MKLNIKINSNNEAFSGFSWQAETARLLGLIAYEITVQTKDRNLIFDLNGNKVGHWNVEINEGKL